MVYGIEIVLRPTVSDDLESLFEFQTDEEGIRLAAFTPKDPTDKSAYLSKYSGLLDLPTVNMQTILVGSVIAGSISKFEVENEAEITYWIDRKFWGKGVASTALDRFLLIEKTRPIYGRVAFDNFGSRRVLEKCGFVKIGEDRGFANARQKDIIEFIYKLD